MFPEPTPQELSQKFSALDTWFSTSQGSRVADAFVGELASHQDPLQGVHLLQLGCCGNNRWLNGLHYRYKWVLTPQRHATRSRVTVVASPLKIPFDRHSLDCVVIPLTFELFSRIHHPLDEIDRVLKPMGHVVLFGVSPLSVWGIALRFGWLSCFGGHPEPLSTVHWLHHHFLSYGYHSCALSHFYYIPPVTSTRWMKQLEVLNVMGKMISPLPANFYCLIMQKHESTLTFLRPATMEKPFVPYLPTPATVLETV